MAGLADNGVSLNQFNLFSYMMNNMNAYTNIRIICE